MPQNSVTGEHIWTGGGNDESTTAQVITTGATINPGVNYSARVAPAAAATGVILAPGQYPGQECVVINESVAASSITFAAAATSHVADGATTALPGLQARSFVWDSITQLWYREN